MQKSKALTFQMIFMYIIQIPAYISLIALFFTKYIEFAFYSLVTSIVINIVMLPLLLVTVISSIKYLKGCDYSISSHVLKIKIALIPWFVVNFILCASLMAGLLNPLLMLAIPIYILIECGVTYLYMASISLASTLNVIGLSKEGKLKIDKLTIISIILQFIFALDILGAYLLNKKLSKQID